MTLTPPAAPFQFGSRISIDLTWTLRYRLVRPTERLVSPSDLHDWATAAGLPVEQRPSPADLSEVRLLREAIYRAAQSVISDRRITEEDQVIINRWAAEPTPVPQLAPDGTVATVGTRTTFTPVVALVARDAVDVLTRADGRLRCCADEQCSLLFYDGSRPGQRRWCDTQRCGNRANTKAYRQRKG